MHRRVLKLTVPTALALALSLTACGQTDPSGVDAAASSDTGSTTSSTRPTPSTSTSTTSESTTTTTDGADATTAAEYGAAADDTVTEDDLVAFVATVERMLADGPYEGAVYESPELYVATAQSFCGSLADGAGMTAIVNDFAEQSDLDLADGSDQVLAGAVLGAGVGVLCPEYATELKI